ncbi:MAG: hypothetical protein C5B49_06780 [Bdellovibrio sp.]|nr:MAG: hypothetical protein C5B49_06780 [Bdellovibrio sp.]
MKVLRFVQALFTGFTLFFGALLIDISASAQTRCPEVHGVQIVSVKRERTRKALPVGKTKWIKELHRNVWENPESRDYLNDGLIVVTQRITQEEEPLPIGAFISVQTFVNLKKGNNARKNAEKALKFVRFNLGDSLDQIGERIGGSKAREEAILKQLSKLYKNYPRLKPGRIEDIFQFERNEGHKRFDFFLEEGKVRLFSRRFHEDVPLTEAKPEDLIFIPLVESAPETRASQSRKIVRDEEAEEMQEESLEFPIFNQPVLSIEKPDWIGGWNRLVVNPENSDYVSDRLIAVTYQSRSKKRAADAQIPFGVFIPGQAFQELDAKKVIKLIRSKGFRIEREHEISEQLERLYTVYPRLKPKHIEYVTKFDDTQGGDEYFRHTLNTGEVTVYNQDPKLRLPEDITGDLIFIPLIRHVGREFFGAEKSEAPTRMNAAPVLPVDISRFEKLQVITVSTQNWIGNRAYRQVANRTDKDYVSDGLVVITHDDGESQPGENPVAVLIPRKTFEALHDAEHALEFIRSRSGVGGPIEEEDDISAQLELLYHVYPQLEPHTVKRLGIFKPSNNGLANLEANLNSGRVTIYSRRPDSRPADGEGDFVFVPLVKTLK